MLCAYTEKRDCERRCKRIIVSSAAELIVSDVSYAGIIENISKCGLYLITSPSETPREFSLGTRLELTLHLFSGESLNLPCKVRWSYKTPPYGLTNSMGMQIIGPPQKYKEFYETLLFSSDKKSVTYKTADYPTHI